MQRRLINHRSHQYGRAIRSTLHGQPAEPLRPVVLEVSLDTHFIDVGHPKLAAPPSATGSNAAKLLRTTPTWWRVIAPILRPVWLACNYQTRRFSTCPGDQASVAVQQVGDW